MTTLIWSTDPIHPITTTTKERNTVITIDRSAPSFVARAVGVLTGTLRPSPDGSSGILITRDQIEIPITIHERALAKLIADPTLFTEEVDCLVWPRTNAMELRAIVINLETAAKNNPDRDHFLIQGISLRSRQFTRTSKIGIKPNTSDRKNTSRFERFWISLHGYLAEGLLNTVYQVKALRKGSRLFIVESCPHIRQGKRWTLSTTKPQNTKPFSTDSSRSRSARDTTLLRK